MNKINYEVTAHEIYDINKQIERQELRNKELNDPKIQKRINSLKEEREELINIYNKETEILKGVKFSLAQQLEFISLYKKQQEVIFLKGEELSRFHFFNLFRDAQNNSLSIAEFKKEINSLYSAYKNTKDNIKTKGKIHLKNSSSDVLAIEGIFSNDTKIINKFFELCYNYIDENIVEEVRTEAETTGLKVRFIGFCDRQANHTQKNL